MALKQETKRRIQVYIDSKEIDGSVRSIRDRIKQLTQEMNKLTIGTEEYEATAKKISELNSVMREHRINIAKTADAYRSLGQRIKDLVDTGIGTFFGNLATNIWSSVTSGISGAISSASELAMEAEGVKIAFDRLNDPKLLDNLRSATHGTVDDLTLMQQAVKFKDFNLPVEQLGTYLAYAQQKAKDTGQDINYLVDSIVTGLGRQSPQILDNLGLSAKQISEEAKKSGDFFGAVAKIIEENMAASGEYVETASDRAARANAELKNAQLELGEALQELKGSSAEALGAFQVNIIRLITWIVKHRTAVLALTAAVAAAYAWHMRETIAINAKAVATRLNAAATVVATTAQRAWTSASILAHYAVTLLTRGFTALRVQMTLARMESVAIQWGPLALAITGVGLAVYGLVKAFSSSTEAVDQNTAAMRANKMRAEDMGSIQKEVANSAAAQKNKVEQLTAIIKDNTAALSDRWAAAKKLESFVPGYHASLQTEGNLYKRNEKAIADYIAALDRMALARAINKKMEERLAKQIDIDMAFDTWVKAIGIRAEKINKLRGELEKSGLTYDSYANPYANNANNPYAWNANDNPYQKIRDELRASQEQQQYNIQRMQWWQNEKKANEAAMAALNAYRKAAGITNEEWIRALSDNDFGLGYQNVSVNPSPTKTTGKNTTTGKTETEEEKQQKEIKEKIKKIEEQSQEDLHNLKEKWRKGDIRSEYEYKKKMYLIQAQALSDMLDVAGVEPEERRKIYDKLHGVQDEYWKNEKEHRDEELGQRKAFDQHVQEELEAFHDRNVEMQKEEKEKQARQIQAYNDKVLEMQGVLGTALGNAFEKIFAKEKDAWKDFLKEMLVTLMDAIEKQIAAYYAAIMAREVATKGWMGAVSAGAQLALITAAFEAAKAGVKSFDTGGFTGPGAWDDPKGVVHAREFVANRFATANRHVLPVLSLIDAAQRTGSVSRLTSSDIAAVLPTPPQAARGAATRGRTTAGREDTRLAATIDRMADVMDDLKKRLDTPIVAETYVTGAGSVNDAQQLYERMRSNVTRKTK